jgi:thiamine pyrophosphokinase
VRAAIVSGGTLDEAFASGFIRNWGPDHLIAADLGLYYCREMGLTPDHIVGDFDSLPAGEKLPEGPGVDVRTFRPEKDDTDTSIAAELAVELGADEIVFLGATGTRLDHVLANIGVMCALSRKGIRAQILDAHNRISVLLPSGNERAHITITKSGQYGKYVSFAPFGGPVRDLSLTGFKYPLHSRTVGSSDAQFLTSNEIADDEAVVSFSAGELLMIESRD